MAMSRSFGATWLTTRPPIRILARGNVLQAGDHPQRVVLLPQPDGPTSTRNSRSCDRQVDVVDRLARRPGRPSRRLPDTTSAIRTLGVDVRQTVGHQSRAGRIRPTYQGGEYTNAARSARSNRPVRSDMDGPTLAIKRGPPSRAEEEEEFCCLLVNRHARRRNSTARGKKHIFSKTTSARHPPAGKSRAKKEARNRGPRRRRSPSHS